MSFVHSRTHTIEELEARVNTPMMDETLGLMRDLWKQNSGGIIHYARTRDPQVKADVDPAENPLLARAIEEIRDGYFAISHKASTLDLMRPRHMIRAVFARKRERAVQQPFDAVENEINDAAILHNATSWQRLMQKNYGFSSEQAAGILKDAGKEGAEAPAPMTLEDSRKLLGKIIGRSLSCYEELTDYRPMIPQVFRRNDSDPIPGGGGAKR